MPLDLDGLQKWQLGDWLLTSGLPLEEGRELAAARGDLPVHDPDDLWAEVSGAVRALRAAAASHASGPVLRAPVSLSLRPPSGPVRLTGSVRLTGGVLLDVSYSSLKPGSALPLRIEVAALSAMGRRCEGVLVRRDKKSARKERELGLSEPDARARLEMLLALRASGLAAPLPFAPGTSQTYADAIAECGQAGAEQKARRAWTGTTFRPGEGSDREHLEVWDGDFDALLQAPVWAGWPHSDTEPHLFGQLARLVFDGGAP